VHPGQQFREVEHLMTINIKCHSFGLTFIFFLLSGIGNLAHAQFELRPAQSEVKYDNKVDEYDSFRKSLLETGQVYDLDTKNSPGARLVVEKDSLTKKSYLTKSELKRIASEIARALEEVPRFVGRPFITDKRITVYIYQIDNTKPISGAANYGPTPDTWGIMLAFAQEDKAGVFHEFTHLTERNWGNGGSESLSEGFAEYVSSQLEPGKAHTFTLANADADQLAQAAIQNYSQIKFLQYIGAGDSAHSMPQGHVRVDFYFTSWSFVNFLISNGGIPKFLKVLDAGGTPAAYFQVYGQTYSALLNQWLGSVGESEMADVL
jgi:hypothetical protein